MHRDRRPLEETSALSRAARRAHRPTSSRRARPRSTVRSQVLGLLAPQTKVAEAKEDDAFVDGALAVATSRSTWSKTKYPYMTYEKKAFAQWGQKYLKSAAAAATKG